MQVFQNVELVMITAIIALILAILIMLTTNWKKRCSPYVSDYLQWKEEALPDGVDSEKAHCQVYDFGSSKPIYTNAVLDSMKGRRYGALETCTDSSQLYVAKVRKRCYKDASEVTSRYPYCLLPEGYHADEGDVIEGYSSAPCRDTMKPACAGVRAEEVPTAKMAGSYVEPYFPDMTIYRHAFQTDDNNIINYSTLRHPDTWDTWESWTVSPH